MIEIMHQPLQQESSLQDFHNNFFKLNAYPDKNIIDNLTLFTQNHTHLAVEIVQLICGRLIDNNMPNTYKLPIFYLMDSIIKYTRDSFIPLFAQYLENIYTIIFQNMSDSDKAKLDRLFQTWEERCQLGQPHIGFTLLKKMRDQISHLLPIAPVTQLSNVSYVNHQVPNLQVPGTAAPAANNSSWQASQFEDFDSIQKKYLNLPTAVNKGLVSNSVISDVNYYSNSSIPTNYVNTTDKFTYNSLDNTSSDTIQYSNISNTQPSKRFRDDNFRKPDRRNRSRRSRSNDHNNDRSDSLDRNNKRSNYNNNNKSFDDNVNIEMNNLLTKLLQDLGQSNVMSLNDLKQENFQLYEQIRKQAEINIKTISESDNINQDKKSHPSFVYGFINESSTLINIENTMQLQNRLDLFGNNKTISNTTNIPAVTLTNSRNLASKIDMYIRHITEPTKLPSLLFGPLPLEPSKLFLSKYKNNSNDENVPTSKPSVLPPFKSEDLNIRPTAALKALFVDRPFVCNEDGQRFATSDLLRQHNNKLIAGRIEKLNKVKRGESNDERKSRSWYSNLVTWIGIHKSENQLNNNMTSTDKNSLNSNISEEFIVPADEHFIRCPISKEVFEKVWDDDEGEYMYRNAVKVLITEGADNIKFQLGRPTIEPNVRYMIVRKPLIVDSWISSGIATTLNDAIKRYKSMNKSDEFVNMLLNAAGEDEDGDDIFVILEVNN